MRLLAEIMVSWAIDLLLWLHFRERVGHIFRKPLFLFALFAGSIVGLTLYHLFMGVEIKW